VKLHEECQRQSLHSSSLGVLFGVGLADTWTYGGVVALLGLVALAACWNPARAPSARIRLRSYRRNDCRFTLTATSGPEIAAVCDGTPVVRPSADGLQELTSLALTVDIACNT
jgi:hypothetical protein